MKGKLIKPTIVLVTTETHGVTGSTSKNISDTVSKWLPPRTRSTRNPGSLHVRLCTVEVTTSSVTVVVVTTAWGPSGQKLYGPPCVFTCRGSRGLLTPTTTTTLVKDPPVERPRHSTNTTERNMIPDGGTTQSDGHGVPHPVTYPSIPSQYRHIDPGPPQHYNVRRLTYVTLQPSWGPTLLQSWWPGAPSYIRSPLRGEFYYYTTLSDPPTHLPSSHLRGRPYYVTHQKSV